MEPADLSLHVYRHHPTVYDDRSTLESFHITGVEKLNQCLHILTFLIGQIRSNPSTRMTHDDAARSQERSPT
jgi:hypothetical protein